MEGAGETGEPMTDQDEQLRALLAFAEQDLTRPGTGSGPCLMASGEIDDQALGRRNASVLRHRRSEDDMTEAAREEVGERFAPVGPEMGPPARFVRKQRGAREETEPEAERRSLVVSSVYPSFRAVAPQSRTVRWGRKRKPEVSWDNVARPAHQAGRLERAKAFAGSVAYI